MNLLIFDPTESNCNFEPNTTVCSKQRNFPTREFLHVSPSSFLPSSLPRRDESLPTGTMLVVRREARGEGKKSEEDGTSVQCLHGN